MGVIVSAGGEPKGMVLGVGEGGGDRCVICAGAVDALYQSRIPVGHLFGTSGSLLNFIAYLIGIVDKMGHSWKMDVDVKGKLQRRAWWGSALGRHYYDNGFLRELIDTYLTAENYEKIRQSPILLEFPALNLSRGAVEVVSNRDGHPLWKFKKFVLAAISMPMAFPTVEIDGEEYTDGGFEDNLNLKLALRKAGPEDTVIIFHNFPEGANYSTQKFYLARMALWRASEAKHVALGRRDAEHFDELIRAHNTLLRRVRSIAPWNIFFRGARGRLERDIKEIFKNIGLPVVKKTINIFPPQDLALFKTPTPSLSELAEAYDIMLELALGELQLKFWNKGER